MLNKRKHILALAVVIMTSFGLMGTASAQPNSTTIPQLGISYTQLQAIAAEPLTKVAEFDGFTTYAGPVELFGYPANAMYSFVDDRLEEIDWTWELPAPGEAETLRLANAAATAVTQLLNKTESDLWQRSFALPQNMGERKVFAWMCSRVWQDVPHEALGYVTGGVAMPDNILQLQAGVVSKTALAKSPTNYHFLKSTDDDDWLQGRNPEIYSRVIMPVPWTSSLDELLDAKGAPDANSMDTGEIAMISYSGQTFCGWPAQITYTLVYNRLSRIDIQLQLDCASLTDFFVAMNDMEGEMVKGTAGRGAAVRGSQRALENGGFMRSYFSRIKDEENEIMLMAGFASQKGVTMCNIAVNDARNPENAAIIKGYDEIYK